MGGLGAGFDGRRSRPPDPSLDLALEWAKINLEEQRVCNPDLGCGFVAGWGLSGDGGRGPDSAGSSAATR